MANLRFRPVSLTELPFAVLEHAHWVPHSAGLSERYRPRPDEKRRDEKRYQRLRRFWRAQEIWLTHAFECLLAAGGPRIVADAFRQLTPPLELSNGRLYSSDIPGLSTQVGVPDVIIMNEETLLLVEVKSGATQTSHRYHFRQYVKYMKFAALCLASESVQVDDGVPLTIQNAGHLVVLPSIELASQLKDFDSWQPEVGNEGRMTVANEPAVDNMMRDVAMFLGSAVVRGQHRLNVSVRPSIVPTFVRSWIEVTDSLHQAAQAHGREDLAREARTLLELSRGTLPVRSGA